MVINRLNKIIILLTVVLSVWHTEGFTQGTDLFSVKKSHLWFGFSVSPGMSTINNNNSSSLTGLSSKGKSSLSFSAEGGYMFSDFFGISTGIEYGSLKSDVLLSGTYTTSYDTTDATEIYKRTITGTNIKEVQQISFMRIPFLVNIQIPIGKSLGIYFRPGINFSIPISKSYESSGIFTYDGFYSAYNIHITGVPYEGLEQNYSNTDEGGLKIKSFNTELSVSTGINYLIQDKVQVGVGIVYEKLLSDISDYSDVKIYRLSSWPNQMRSIMEGSSGATASSVGLRISFRYYLK